MKDFGLRGELRDWFRESPFADAYFEIDRKVRNLAINYLVKQFKLAFAKELTRAEQLMTWMQEVTVAISKLQSPIDWTTYLKLPIRHARTKRGKRQEIVTNLDLILRSNRKRRRTMKYREDTNEINPDGAKNAIIANFVHSQDATHMMMTALRAKAQGIQSLRMVHDSFATHASDMDAFSKIIRETFVELYSQDDPVERLYTFCRQVMRNHDLDPDGLKPIPERGSLDIREVLESRYFFS